MLSKKILSGNVLAKFGAYFWMCSLCASSADAMNKRAQLKNLYVYGRQNVAITGTPAPIETVDDISSVSYEDFDVTARFRNSMMERAIGNGASLRDSKLLKMEGHIPYIGGENPVLNYAEFHAVPWFISENLKNRLHPARWAGGMDFFKKVIVKNTAKLDANMPIPDADCLFYKNIGGEQHLFLRLSSKVRQEAELFRKNISGKTLYVEPDGGRIDILSDKDILLDHMAAEADDIAIEAKDTLTNRASKLRAKWTLRLKADTQRHYTIINKWVREDQGKHHFVHAEGVDSVDDCYLSASTVIQEGNNVENYGILVEADTFEDRAVHTTNMPAKITLYNYAWEERDSMFSHAESSVTQRDDVLVPTRYKVNYYTSESPESGSSVKFGYTMIVAGSQIKILKDIKEDVVVNEEHTLEIHEEKSGFSFFGGAKIPDPTNRLKQMQQAYKAGNMIGLTTSTIGAIAKGIQMTEDIKRLKDLSKLEAGQWNAESTQALFSTLAHFVNGPSVQFGRRVVDIKQHSTIGHGNMMSAPEMIFDNKTRSSYAGNYHATNIFIRTDDFVTHDIKQTMDTEMSVKDYGISMDLLSFALILLTPELTSLMNLGMAPAVAEEVTRTSALGAAAKSSSVSVSFQNGKTHQERHLPTVIEATNRLDIEAGSGHLTQAQIKAGIVHAVFTKDCVLETLANENWQTSRGGSLSFSLDLSQKLEDIACSSHFSSIDSGRFERVIDDFASMVGEKEFYLKVEGILRKKSAFVGHKEHDPEHEHIEAGEIQNEDVTQYTYEYDNSFDLNFADIRSISKALANDDKPKQNSEINKNNNDIYVSNGNEDSESDGLIDSKDDELDSRQEVRLPPEKAATFERNANADSAGYSAQTDDGFEFDSDDDFDLTNFNGTDDNSLNFQYLIANESLNDQLFPFSYTEQSLGQSESNLESNSSEEQKTIEANIAARIRFERGEGYLPAKVVMGGTGFAPTPPVVLSGDEINSDEERFSRLQIEELERRCIGPTRQTLGMVPLVGSVVDFGCGDISGRELIGELALEALGGCAGRVAKVGGKLIKIPKTISKFGMDGVSKVCAKNNVRVAANENSVLGNISSKGASKFTKTANAAATGTAGMEREIQGGVKKFNRRIPRKPETTVKEKVARVPQVEKKTGKVQITIEIKQSDLQKFGVKRKIEQMKYDSGIGQNVVTETNRNPKIIAAKRKMARAEGVDHKALNRVDMDHTHELQLGGEDCFNNIRCLDRGVNRSIGRQINNSTRKLPKGTKIDTKFIVKETGEPL